MRFVDAGKRLLWDSSDHVILLHDAINATMTSKKVLPVLDDPPSLVH